MSCYRIGLLLCTLLLLQLVAGSTVQHQRTTIDANGERHIKTWTTHEPDDADFMESANDDAGDYQTFTRGSGTVRIKPSARFIRIGGTDVPPELMIEQAKQMKGLEPVAVRQLLRTRQPVTRTSFENGLKSTATYTLDADGSITCKIVTDVDPKQVDEAFASLFQRQAQTQPEELQPQSHLEPVQKHFVHDWRRESELSAPKPAQATQPTATARNNFEYPKLPEEWNPKGWPRHDPYSPPDLPADEEDFAFPASNEWTHKTVNIATQSERHSEPQPPPTTPPSPPNLQDLRRSQYEASTTPRAVPSHNYAPAPPPDKPVRTIDIDQLPIMGVVNSNGEPMGDLLPLNDDRPIKTLAIENIPRSAEPAPDVEHTKVQTISKTVTSDHVPTAADLDPSMQEILRRAGINPSEVNSAENNTITRVRVEPDGRVVKTTYRMRKMPYMHNVPSSSALDNEWPSLRTRPTHPTRPTRPARFYSGSRNAVRFPAYAPQSTTPADNDEPLEVAKTLNPLLIHPIEPHSSGAATSTAVSGRVGGSERIAPRRHSHSNIEEFLAKLGLTVEMLEAQQGDLVKTIVDEDGRTLTARFLLSGRPSRQPWHREA